MRVQIKSRFSDAVIFEAEIADEFERHSDSIKLGIAVKAAYKVGSDLSGSDLSGAGLSGADLSNAFMSNANLRSANLRDANLRNAFLRNAFLRNANLRDAFLRDADLRGADLSGADLSGAVLSGADLSSSNLIGVSLSNAVLSNVDLIGAKIIRLVARIMRINDPYEFIAFETDNGLIIRAGCRTMSIADYRTHIEREYPDTDKAEETTAILDFIETRAAIFSNSGTV
jgi:hypothetical protein